MALPDALNVLAEAYPAAGLPVRFVPQPAELLDGAYERHIHLRREVPTRDGWHDFFNGLCWLRFPQTKQTLNRLQAEAVAATLERQGSLQGRRGPLRDTLTLFDENAALLQAPEPLWQALLARDWQRLFVTLRPLWAEARLVLFGHALLEKLLQPYASITAHVLCAPVPHDMGAEDGRACDGCTYDEEVGAHTSSPVTAHPWDAWLARRLGADPGWLAGRPAKPFTPLPVLGVPGWWPANESPAFYADQTVFRPPRKPS